MLFSDRRDLNCFLLESVFSSNLEESLAVSSSGAVSGRRFEHVFPSVAVMGPGLLDYK